jgi:hypothetical protein
MSEISIGGKVRLIAIPPYLKTADPMPMLRPPELLDFVINPVNKREKINPLN